MKVETTDLYFSAYLMSKGISLDSMNVQNDGNRQKIIFVFSGNGELDRLNHEFQKGSALVNPIDLKKSILHLKDMMYDKLRSYKPRTMTIRGKEERRYNANIQRKDRSRQIFI